MSSVKRWERYAQDEVMYGGHRKVITKYFKNEDGSVFDFETFDSMGSESVVVLALDEQNRVIIVEQFRVGPEALMQDCPGGGVKRGQTPESAAREELLEETGYKSDNWMYMGATHEHPYSNRNRHYFLALNARQAAEPAHEDLEDIELKKISIEQLVYNAKNGKMTDALIVLYAYDELMKIQKGDTV